MLIYFVLLEPVGVDRCEVVGEKVIGVKCCEAKILSANVNPKWNPQMWVSISEFYNKY